MRGTKRKREILNLEGPVSNWFEASGCAETLPEPGEGKILQESGAAFGEGPKPSLTSHAVPVGDPVQKGANWWLGLRSTLPTQPNGPGEGSNRLLTGYPDTGGYYATGQPLVEEGEGLVPVGAGSVTPGGPNIRPSSLAQEAATWLGAHSNATGRPASDRQGVRTETKGPETPIAGINIDERDLTPEDFWSLLRDAGYEVW